MGNQALHRSNARTKQDIRCGSCPSQCWSEPLESFTRANVGVCAAVGSFHDVDWLVAVDAFKRPNEAVQATLRPGLWHRHRSELRRPCVHQQQRNVRCFKATLSSSGRTPVTCLEGIEKPAWLRLDFQCRQALICKAPHLEAMCTPTSSAQARPAPHRFASV